MGVKRVKTVCDCNVAAHRFPQFSTGLAAEQLILQKGCLDSLVVHFRLSISSRSSLSVVVRWTTPLYEAPPSAPLFQSTLLFLRAGANRHGEAYFSRGGWGYYRWRKAVFMRGRSACLS
jgi:hypothetical protein